MSHWKGTMATCQVSLLEIIWGLEWCPTGFCRRTVALFNWYEWLSRRIGLLPKYDCTLYRRKVKSQLFYINYKGIEITTKVGLVHSWWNSTWVKVNEWGWGIVKEGLNLNMTAKNSCRSLCERLGVNCP